MHSFLQARQAELAAAAPAVPLVYDDLRAEALDGLPRDVYDNVAGAAGSGSTKTRNRQAFDRWRIVPQAMREVRDRDLSVSLFGRDLPAPLGIAPVGSQTLYHDDGEVAPARAAARLGVPFTLSTGSSASLEEVAEAMDEAVDEADDDAHLTPDTDGPTRFFQLYVVEDRDVVRSLVTRAEAAGYDAIFVTVDGPISRWRPRNLQNDFTASDHVTKGNFVQDPVVRERYDEGGDEYADLDAAATAVYRRKVPVTWDDLAFVREHTDLPIVVKGVVNPPDAAEVAERGYDGVVVSNHGGRQVDGAIGAVEALPRVVEAVSEVDDEIPVLLDSGVRTAADVFRALALGAEAAFIGRPFVFGLAIAGEQGVYEVTHNYLAELDSIVGLSGRTSLDEVGRDAVMRPE